MKNSFFTGFEGIFCYLRYLIFIPVVLSLLAFIVLLVSGSCELWCVFTGFKWHALTQGGTMTTGLVMKAISGLVAVLLSVVFLVFGLGMHNAFVHKMDETKTSGFSIKISSFDQVKEFLARVFVLILVIGFFRSAYAVNFVAALELLYFGLGVLAVSLAVYFVNKKG